MPQLRITAVTPTVHLVEGPAVNWVVLTDTAPGPGTPFTLVDGGYPAYADGVRASLVTLGLRESDLAAVLVTHGHVDHVGGLTSLLTGRDDVPLLTSEVEARHLRGEVHESAGPLDLLPRLHQHGMLPRALGIVRAGATEHPSFAQVRGVPDGVALDLPGRPVPVTTPGHTSGHTVLHLPEQGVVVTGDALVTGHPLSRVTGPQVLRDFFHHDAGAMLASLDLIGDLDADAVLPGHGPLWRGAVADAARTALAGAGRTLAGRA